MKRIGITGGIGSGKSVVARWLRSNGFAVYDTDAQARRLMNESAEIRSALTDRFGPETYSEQGLNRSLLAEKVFNDADARAFVNAVVHPAVSADFMSWSYAREAEIVFVESAILYECNLKDLVNDVIYVDAPLELRIARTMHRDGASREEVERRIRAQQDHKDEARWVINNSFDIAALSVQMEAVAVEAGWIAPGTAKPIVEEQQQGEKKKKKKVGAWGVIWRTALILWGLSVLWVVIGKWVPVWYTPLMLRRAVEAKVEGREVHFDRTWVSLDQVSERYVRACIASEDNLFATHYGFSKKGIEKAWKNNQKGKKLRGGSTISQQTAKNVFTFGTRTWVRKGIETYYTVLIELIWGKERIMEVYCNIAELGDGVYGVEAASQKYFHCPARRLNTQQAALMAAALPSPRRYSISRPGPYMLKRQGNIIWNMNNVRRFPEK